MRREKLLIVCEFPPGEQEWHLRDLADGLRRNVPDRDIRFCHGFSKRYRPGGLRPFRILNGIWVHLRAFLEILFGSFDRVIVRSVPPLIQMTVAHTCRLGRVPYGIWLMDAHPELEVVIWARVPVVNALSRLLAKWNARCLARADFVVVLDEAMRLRVLPELPLKQVIVCPTWGKRLPERTQLPAKFEESLRALRFVYLGNLGIAHDIPLMCRVLAACAKCGGVELTFFGTAPKAVDAVVRKLTGSGVKWESMPGIPFEQLNRVLPALSFDFGIVTLNEAFSGLLSPSKYVGYLVAGLPLVYIGPSGNNSAEVCDRLDAGLRLGASAFECNDIDKTVGKLRDAGLRERLRQNTGSALQFFEQFDGQYLAAEIDLRLHAKLGDAFDPENLESTK